MSKYKTIQRRFYSAVILPQILILGVACLASADEFAAKRAEVLALGKLTHPPAVMDADGFDRKDGIRAIYFDALDYEEKPTKVFAWLGMPEKREGKVPGVVLVHGGGGTAFRQWVTKWNEKGFAAIAIAHEGQVERREEKRRWAKHAWPGPWRRGHYADFAKPLKDQWMYHAVADSILANSLLRSLPEVDEDKVGIMGVSWGGVITSTVMGIDSRFAFAIPTYGCGKMADAANHWGAALSKNTLYREVWDPMHYLPQAKMPTLWFSWPEDRHFPLDSLAASYRAMRGDFMISLLPGMKHSSPASWNPPDSYAFAASVVRDGTPWCRQTKVEVDNSSLEVIFSSLKPFDRAVLVSTTELGFTGSRKWLESPAKLNLVEGHWVATADLPKETTACFLNANAGDLTVSSEYVEIISDTNVSPTKAADEAWRTLVGKRFAKRPEFAYVENNPALPNVLIYGDSISIGYTQRVRAKTKGKANVYRLYHNGGNSEAFIPMMKKMHVAMRDKQLDKPWTFQWDVIHFNVGLHDLTVTKPDEENGNHKRRTPIEVYKKNFDDIVTYLEQLAPNAKLIFATTTPVPKGTFGPRRISGDAQRYNAAAIEVLRRASDIEVNDLFSFTKPNHSKWWSKPGNVHFNETGRNAQGDEVARVILNALSKKP